ncbi:hypothetical protein MAR_035455 [Mya arenaria]|uniref:Uncharacterized protein n=2 Tax=Mya arenaria TaxID=6604 RepID=A0ABY7EMQ0_MYAAR|nr:uncharacterized protein LOC128240545 isoform X2 [Mya arenaria]XP_052813175.1 uncharacterized protein LOC128240545 isoform X2 [Mya arenaria]WAR10379.1 hypothetical protein MAR_035455 [Mya arenaria]
MLLRRKLGTTWILPLMWTRFVLTTLFMRNTDKMQQADRSHVTETKIGDNNMDITSDVDQICADNPVHEVIQTGLTTWKRFLALVSWYSASKKLELALGLWKRSLSL